MSNAARAGILALLEVVPNLNVHDGEVDTDEEAKVIVADLPYAVVYFGPGFPNPNERLCASRPPAVVTFTVGNVGERVQQTLWVVDKTRGALERVRWSGSLIRLVDSDPAPRRDDTYTRPGGGSLFYVGDRYEMAL